MEARIDAAVVDWVKRIPVDQIPGVIAILAARQMAAAAIGSDSNTNDTRASESGRLLTPGQLAERLNVRESWVRAEERAGQIPSVRLGRYVRFKLSDVERELAERNRDKS